MLPPDFVSSQELREEYATIVSDAESFMNDANALLNNDLHFERFNVLLNNLDDTTAQFQDERAHLIRQESVQQQQLKELMDQERRIKSVLRGMRVFTPVFPKRLRVYIYMFLLSDNGSDDYV
jgi:hypothetical protein